MAAGLPNVDIEQYLPLLKIVFTCMSAATSAAKPAVLGASCDTTNRPVFLTDRLTVSKSQGRMVLRFDTKRQNTATRKTWRGLICSRGMEEINDRVAH